MLLPLLDIVLEGLARAVRQENEKLPELEGRSKTADDTIMYIGNPKEATKNAVTTNK